MEHTLASESPLLRLLQRKDHKGHSYIDAKQFAAGDVCAQILSALISRRGSPVLTRHPQAQAVATGR